MEILCQKVSKFLYCFGDCRISVSPIFMAVFPRNSGEYLVPDSTSSAGVLGDSPAEKEAEEQKKKHLKR